MTQKNEMSARALEKEELENALEQKLERFLYLQEKLDGRDH